MKESKVVEHIVDWLNYKERWFINVHGSKYSKNGTPDIVTLDFDNRLLCIEVKAPKKTLRGNQWEKAIDVIFSGGRYIVGHYDFDLDKLDHAVNDLPKIEISNDKLLTLDYAENLKVYETTEIIPKF